jgi:hypothetical protein
MTPQEQQQLHEIKRILSDRLQAIAKRTPKVKRESSELGDVFSVRVDGKLFNLPINSQINTFNTKIK